MSLPEALRQRPLVGAGTAFSRSLTGQQSRPWVASAALFSVVYAGYLFLGALIVFRAGSIPIDTWARVGNAYYALFSRDPHVIADHWAARNLRLWQVILVWILALDLLIMALWRL